eukprot:6257524-Prymnesium_polylepis.1
MFATCAAVAPRRITAVAAHASPRCSRAAVPLPLTLHLYIQRGEALSLSTRRPCRSCIVQPYTYGRLPAHE